MTIVTNENVEGKGGKRKMKREKNINQEIFRFLVRQFILYPISSRFLVMNDRNSKSKGEIKSKK